MVALYSAGILVPYEFLMWTTSRRLRKATANMPALTVPDELSSAISEEIATYYAFRIVTFVLTLGFGFLAAGILGEEKIAEAMEKGGDGLENTFDKSQA